MILKNQQIDVFKKESFKQFEDEMLLHVKEYFPNHYHAIEEEHLRNTIRHGYRRAKAYGLSSVRNVCMYLNNMLLLGSNFDQDPQYPWAREILSDTTIKAPNLRIDKLSDSVLDFLSKMSGPRNIYVYRALLEIAQHKAEIFNTLITSNIDKAFVHFESLYRNKSELVGRVHLQEMVQYGKRMALRHGITDESCLLVYVVCMFLMGSGFDADPQFYWAGEILNNKESKEREKIQHLYQKATGKLEITLSQYIP